MDIKMIKSIIEALLFVSGEAIPLKQLSQITNVDESTLRKLINQMIDSYNQEDRGIQMIEVNNCYQLCTRIEHYEYIEKLIKPHAKQGLSQASLETLSIIAYKQPITKAQIDSIRGVRSDGCLSRLLEKELIIEVGRLDAPGKPIIYSTTNNFLKLFGLKTINELPKINELETDK